MTFYTIHPRELEDIMRRKHGILIDVREADSYREYHYPNARNLPYEKIDQWMHRLPKNRPLVLYCDYGSTSLLAARKLGRGMRYIPWLAALRQCEQVIDREN